MRRTYVDVEGHRHLVHAWTPEIAGRPGAVGHPPVLALHGFGVSGDRTFRYLAPGLRRAGVPLYAPDLLGFGGSDAPPPATGDGPLYGLRAYAARTLRLADALGLDRPVLLGHSMGGKIAAATAALHPDRFACLVLVAPGGFTRLARLTPLLAGAADRLGLFRRPWFYQTVLPRTPLASVFPDAASREALARLRGAHRALDLDLSGVRPLLRRLRLPTLVLWGADDPILPERTARRVLRDLPHATLHVLPGAGHAPMRDRPDAVAKVLVSFLQ